MEIRSDSIERGMALIRSAGEVMPDEARGEVSELYYEITRTLRVPVVNFIFRVLATEALRLESCWRAVRPMLRTAECERRADALRAAAALSDEGPRPEIHRLADGEVRAFTRTIQYVLPKLLLVATALSRALRGEAVRRAPPELEPELHYGLAPGTHKMELLSLEDTEGEVREALTQIRDVHHHPGVASYFRAIARRPAFLGACWSELRPWIDAPAYRSAKDELLARAEAALEELPVSPEALADLGDQAASEVCDILEVFRARLIPDLLLDVTLIRSWIEGAGQATRSPFPVPSRS